MATINLTPISNVAITAKSLSNLILVTANAPVGYQPQSKPTEKVAPKSFFFTYEGDQSVMLTSDITDHYVEDNTAIADQIALKPEEITVNGFVGELNDVVPDTLKYLKVASERLTVVNAYVPEISLTAILAYDNAKFFYDTAVNIANQSVESWQSINNLRNGTSQVADNQPLGQTTQKPGQTKQQVAFLYFYGYWKDRRLFTVQTPWMIMNDMVIKSLKAYQNSESNQYSDFEITFKKMRFASTIVTTLREQTLGNEISGRANNQYQAGNVVDNGTSSPAQAGGRYTDRFTPRTDL